MGPKQDHQKTGRKIRQRALQGQANGQAGSTQYGDKAGGLNPQLAQGGQNHERQQRDIGHVGHEAAQGLVHLGIAHHLADHADHRLGHPAADHENGNGGDHFQAVDRDQFPDSI
jgi:hypothetical protein